MKTKYKSSFTVAVSVATLVVSVGCSRRTSGAAVTDSASPKADSIAAATLAKPDSVRAPATKSTRSTTARTKSGTTTAAVVGRLRLIKLTPLSGSLATGQVITVEIAGEGFTASGNTTFFGTVKLGDLPSADGRTIRFAVPQNFPSRGEVPPMAMQPGRYAVYVVNSNGASDTLTFTIRNQ